MSIDSLLHDLRSAVRLLLKNPSFAVISVFTLALGIGAATAMFSVVNSVLLSPFPFSKPDELVLIKERIPVISPRAIRVPPPDVLTFRQQTKSFVDVAGYIEDDMDLTGQGSPHKVQISRITANLLPLLGVSPVLGRNFAAEEDRANASKAAILSFRTWQTVFGGDQHILGKTVTLNRIPHVIVGVMPQSFIFPLETYKEDSVLWVPMAFTDEEQKSFGDNFDYNAIARLKPGVSIQKAQADVERVAAIIRDQYPATLKSQFNMQGVVVPLRDATLGDYRQPLTIMMMAVVLLLLIAIANVANLLIAKGSARKREISIRVALGASSSRLLRQLLTESTLLGLVAGAVGTAFAQLGTETLVSLVPANIPRLHATQLDWRVLLFAIVISILSGIVFGIAPALFALRMNVNEGLKEGGRAGMYGRQHRYVRTAFVVAQFSLALILLVGAGLLIRSFQRVLAVDPGFRVDHIISGATSLPRSQYKEPAQRIAFYNELQARLSHLPGVVAAGASTDLPLEGNWNKIFTLEGVIPPPGAGLNVNNNSVVLGDYFQAVGIPLIRGRLFNDHDTAGTTRVILISKGMADTYFGKQDPIGRRLKWGPEASTEAWRTIIGVVGDVKQGSLDQETAPHTYESYHQYESGPGSMNLVLRSQADPNSLANSFQQAVHELDRELPVTDLRTMEQVVQESNASRRFYVILIGVFSAVAIVLASVGLYGVVAFAVQQRTREIGIRMTLGATDSNVLGMLLRWAMLLVVMGIATGVAGAFAVTRLLSSFLFGTSPNDPLTFVSVSVLLSAVALLASYIPARRATRVDPMIALRYE